MRPDEQARQTERERVDRAEAGPEGRFADAPTEIPGRGWWKVAKRAVGRLIGENLSTECAGVAFFGLFSLFPAIVAAVLVYGLVADAALVREHLAVARDFLPGAAYQILEDRVVALASQPASSLGIGLLVSLVLALWSASRGVSTMILVIGLAYRETDERGFLTGVVISVLFTLGGAAFLLFAVLAVAAIPAIVSILPLGPAEETLVELVRWPVLAVVVMLAITCLYRFGPDRENPKWRWILPGAVLSSALWLIFSFAFSFYVDNFASYDAYFGSLAAIVVLMLWLYYSIMIIVLGAVLNAELEYQTERDSTTGPPEPMGERGAYVADNVVPR